MIGQGQLTAFTDMARWIPTSTVQRPTRPKKISNLLNIDGYRLVICPRRNQLAFINTNKFPFCTGIEDPVELGATIRAMHRWVGGILTNATDVYPIQYNRLICHFYPPKIVFFAAH